MPTRLLNRVAERIASGANLRDAMKDSGFRARASRELSASGIPDDAALRTLAAQRFCRELGESTVSQIGVARHGDRIWLVLAEPFSAPALSRPDHVAEEVLGLVNEARRSARRCGATAYPAASPLVRSRALDAAASAHAADMIEHDRLSHEGSNGSQPGDRASKAGYRWRVMGENVAAGADSARQVVAGWLSSPEHCENIMDARFAEMGIAYRIDWSRDAGIYWAQEFGLQRKDSGR